MNVPGIAQFGLVVPGRPVMTDFRCVSQAAGVARPLVAAADVAAWRRQGDRTGALRGGDP